MPFFPFHLPLSPPSDASNPIPPARISTSLSHSLCIFFYQLWRKLDFDCGFQARNTLLRIPGHPVDACHFKLIIPGLIDQLNSMKKMTLPNLLTQHLQVIVYVSNYVTVFMTPYITFRKRYT
ncbi:uncharacterized protein LOC111317845 [Durio zibethinus]|uniref:Uncharacterized protein LOC111317845 n=1 Tax=Durio zibethinus TaxID=66656 RepID=A0A6P6BG18_DURZI|nr:uncharacterized protein LOC111317845 [Durio zibethinus]